MARHTTTQKRCEDCRGGKYCHAGREAFTQAVLSPGYGGKYLVTLSNVALTTWDLDATTNDSETEPSVPCGRDGGGGDVYAPSAPSAGRLEAGLSATACVERHKDRFVRHRYFHR